MPPKFDFAMIPRRLLFSGVGALLSSRSGDRGVSPADESSKSLVVVLRGVVNKELKALPGICGRGLLGEFRRLGVCGFRGESNTLRSAVLYDGQ